MALGDPYARLEDLEALLGKTDDGSFLLILDAASRQVEAFTRRQFNRLDDDYPPTRRFRALDPERLPVDDFWKMEHLAVDVDGTVWEADQYDPRPWNGQVEGMEGWPYFDLFAVGRSWPIKRRATVYVTADWGWAEVPSGIVQATLQVAKVIANVSTGSTGSYPIRSEAVDGYSVSFAIPDASAIAVTPGVSAALATATPYRRKRFGVA